MWHKIWRALRNHATEIHNNFSFRVRRYLTAQVERSVLHVSFWCNSNCSHLCLQIFSKRLLCHYMTDKKLGHSLDRCFVLLKQKYVCEASRSYVCMGIETEELQQRVFKCARYTKTQAASQWVFDMRPRCTTNTEEFTFAGYLRRRSREKRGYR